MINQTSRGPRAEHRQLERQRIEDAATLAQSYPRLKSLTVHLEFVDVDGVSKPRELKYRLNLDHAKSVLLFACPSAECMEGDFDLTTELARAISSRRKLVTGQLCCQGSRKRAPSEMVPCRSVLRYRLNLAYGTAR